MKKLLNVGAGQSLIPVHYADYEMVRLDIDPATNPDVLMDARNLRELTCLFDAVYCAHNLEHYTPHDGGIVIKGMRGALLPGGFADIIVPNVGLILQEAGKMKWDLDSFLYQSSGGAICVRDVLFGQGGSIEFSDNDYMIHKNAFSARTLPQLMKWCGFAHIFVAQSGLDLRCVGFLNEPTEEQLKGIGLAE